MGKRQGLFVTSRRISKDAGCSELFWVGVTSTHTKKNPTRVPFSSELSHILVMPGVHAHQNAGRETRMQTEQIDQMLLAILQALCDI